MLLASRKVVKITGSKTLFLDGVRLLSSLIIVFIHAHDQWFGETLGASNISHGVVIVFFVLSGFVISYTTTSNNRGCTQYAQARLSRLWSIVLPSLLITAVIEILVAQYNPEVSLGYVKSHSWLRYFLSATFLNEIWLFSAAPPINRPLWSLSYEFWYYVIFGLWFYRKLNPWFSAVLVLACLIAGPKILLLLPAWLAGYLAYRLPKLLLPNGLLVVLSAAALFTIGVVIGNLSSVPFIIGRVPLFYSNQFLTDWLIAALFSAALWLFPSTDVLSIQENWIRNFRKGADLTFPIYILHHPLLILWGSIVGYQYHNAAQMWLALLVVVAVCALIGRVLEAQRTKWKYPVEYVIFMVRTCFLAVASKRE